MGCGIVLLPHGPFIEKSKILDDAAEAVQSSLRSLSKFKKACGAWKAKLDGAETVEGVSVAVDTVRRLIASVVLARWNPVNENLRKKRPCG